MQNKQDKINDWLLHEAHVVTGHAFRMADSSCLPVWPESAADKKNETPQGFLVTHGNEVAYQDAHTPEGEQIMSVWAKCHVLEIVAEQPVQPAEYWYG